MAIYSQMRCNEPVLPYHLFSEYLMALFSIKLFFKEIGAETF